jgi:hypothetical protein
MPVIPATWKVEIRGSLSKASPEQKQEILSFFFFFAVLGFELRIYTFSHSTSSFLCDGSFRDRVS